MSSNNPENVIQIIKRLIESSHNYKISINANGGNTILIVCPPIEEVEYINTIYKLLASEKYRIIDLNELLIEFVNENKTNIDYAFELLKESINQIFKAPQGEEGPDFFELIINAIVDSFKSNKIPVLINSGSLYGSGISNIHIMEHSQIINSPLPLIILYPATKQQDKLMFLGKRPASKYRCMVID